ncbi:MAG: DMT family transporter [Oscillospiraceae bacterium]|nr:DMT family transporter [Oscillospiraceae bacterium]
MWFWFAIITLLCWSGSDFFSKIGCRDNKDKYSQFKMVMAVGLVMGVHALIEIIGGVEISWQVIWTYLPVSLLYIGSMALGYVGLRYIELSISSPICNASGALVAIIAIVTGTADPMDWPQYLAITLAAAGVIALGFVEAREDNDLRAARQEASNYKYAKSWLALALPIAYCLLDAAGTFADDLVLETLNEDSANVAYELTFFAAGVVCFIYTVLIKKQPLVANVERPKYIGAIFETAGQLFYIYALASGEAALAAPIISSYCVASVLWSRLFLKEKLSWKHYACIATTIVGIIIMGIYDM